ncbi:hypothetical protein EDD16DRAFT_1593841 [Pisolithus croceorrhizus]|nr:hypothetical protein EDD16DRAFT_1593841 [Pisolithus croceorrhizus]
MCVHSFGIYSSTVINNITGGSSPLSIVLGWSVVINAFYIPGTLLGTFLIDYLGLRTTMVYVVHTTKLVCIWILFCQIVGLLLQAATGFAMSTMYSHI